MAGLAQQGASTHPRWIEAPFRWEPLSQPGKNPIICFSLVCIPVVPLW